jgi:hypothetical protein
VRGPGAFPLEPAIEQNELRERSRPDRDGGGDHGGHGGGGCSEHMPHRHDQQDQHRPREISRGEREIDPIERARDAVLGVGHRIDRQAQAGEDERNEIVGFELPLEQQHERDADGGRDRAEAEGEPAAAEQESAQTVELAVAEIFGNEALRRGGQTERHQRAEQEHPGPDINIDAEFEAAHPAREHDLGQKHDSGGSHPDQEGGAGDAARDRMIAAVGKERNGARIDPARARAHVAGFRFARKNDRHADCLRACYPICA